MEQRGAGAGAGAAVVSACEQARPAPASGIIDPVCFISTGNVSNTVTRARGLKLSKRWPGRIPLMQGNLSPSALANH